MIQDAAGIGVTIETSPLISANKTEITLVLWSFGKRLIKALEKSCIFNKFVSSLDVVFRCLK